MIMYGDKPTEGRGETPEAEALRLARRKVVMSYREPFYIEWPHKWEIITILIIMMFAIGVAGAAK